MNKRLDAAMIAVAVVTLVVAMMWANIRTYHVATQVAFDTVIWNDRQLVLFINTLDDGASMTMFEAVPRAAQGLFGRWGTRDRVVRSNVTIVRYEDGALTRALIGRRGEPFPKFVEGRPYLLGGVWTGRQLVPIDGEEQRRISGAPRNTGEWHSENALFFHARGGTRDISVHVGGEKMSLRTTRTGDERAIDLIRHQASPLRLWSGSTAGRSVSAAEFERLFPTIVREGFPAR